MFIYAHTCKQVLPLNITQLFQYEQSKDCTLRTNRHLSSRRARFYSDHLIHVTHFNLFQFSERSPHLLTGKRLVADGLERPTVVGRPQRRTKSLIYWRRDARRNISSEWLHKSVFRVPRGQRSTTFSLASPSKARYLETWRARQHLQLPRKQSVCLMLSPPACRLLARSHRWRQPLLSRPWSASS